MGGDAAELGGQVLGGDAGVERCVEGVVNFADLRCGFVDEFEAVVDDAGVSPRVEVGAGFLGFGAEDGIAAAYIG